MNPEQNPFQTTLNYPVTCTGVALHSGAQVTMTLKPAETDHGIVFVRRDIDGAKARVPARYDAVVETRLGTTIANAHGTKVMTVEHLMAALWGCGVDNCLIELDGPEVPIMDGSSEPFVFLIECAGIEILDTPRRIIEVLRTVAVEDGNSTAILSPAEYFELDITIHFDHQHIGTQQANYDFTRTNFKQALCRARTFGFARDVEAMRAAGLARGGSLRNAIVLDEHEIVNSEGLRYGDEFVRHKALDCVGDYFLAGSAIRGAVTTLRPGHHINNLLMRALFSDAKNYRVVEMDHVTAIAANSMMTQSVAAAL
jgi:UDP-3-O-[3-hydroxymyristoyl] N-acetylglucosamine deacetylase